MPRTASKTTAQKGNRRTVKAASKAATRTQSTRGRRASVSTGQPSMSAHLTNVIAAAASAAAAAAVQAIEGGVASIGVPQQGQSQSAGTATTSRRGGNRRPGAPVNPGSAMSAVREGYQNALRDRSIERADLVADLANKLGKTKAVINTYVSKLDKANGFKLANRSNRGGSRNRRTSQGGQSQSQSSGNQSNSNGGGNSQQ
jgi:hypothetical protein